MCDCIKTMNSRLAESNGHLITTLFGTPRAVIGSVKVDSKKRGQPPAAIASFCPFCGEAYEAPKARATPEQIAGLSARARALWDRLREGRFYQHHADDTPKAMAELDNAGLVEVMARPVEVWACWVPAGSRQASPEVIAQ